MSINIICDLRAIQGLYPSSILDQNVKVVSAFHVSSLGDLVGEGHPSPIRLSSLAIAWAYHSCMCPDFARSHVGYFTFTDQEIERLAEQW